LRLGAKNSPLARFQRARRKSAVHRNNGNDFGAPARS